jgi:hypothetical protein
MDLLGFNSQPGTGVQAAVHFCFSEPVNHYPKPWLQGRCKYKLSDYYVGLILQATIRGVVVDFRLQQISKVFSFVVASRNVGFHIYNLRSFSCDQYVLYFNLWSDDGAQWRAEFAKYCLEEANQWTEVTGRREKLRNSYANFVRSNSHLSGAKCSAWQKCSTSVNFP